MLGAFQLFKEVPSRVSMLTRSLYRGYIGELNGVLPWTIYTPFDAYEVIGGESFTISYTESLKKKQDIISYDGHLDGLYTEGYRGSPATQAVAKPCPDSCNNEFHSSRAIVGIVSDTQLGSSCSADVLSPA